jgi:hypothetical protein
MNITGLGADRLRLKLRIMSDDDLWWLFLDHREECLREFLGEVEARKAAGRLSKNSPFWTMGELARYRQPRGSGGNSNLIELTREEWEVRRRRKLFRVISASIATDCPSPERNASSTSHASRTPIRPSREGTNASPTRG